MTTPRDYDACQGTGQPGIGTPTALGDVRCSVCGRLVNVSKTGKVRRHANPDYWVQKRAGAS